MELLNYIRRTDFLRIQRWKWEIPALVAIVSLTFWRLSSVMPSFLADEFLYKQQALNSGPYQDSLLANTGNYLYFWLFSSVDACGPNFYACSKFLNASIWLLAGIALFTVGTRFLGRGAAFLLSATVLAFPLSSYVTVFMPEATYYAFSILVVIFLWFYLDSPSSLGSAYLGMALGFLWLIKPNALLLLPALMFFALGLMFSKFRAVFLVRHFVVLVSAILAIRFAGGLFLAGPRSLSIFADYGDAGSSGLSAVPALLQTFLLILPTQVFGHALVITVGLGPLLVIGLAAFARGHRLDQTNRRLLVVIAITHLLLLAGAILFTALVTHLGDDHTYRVLARYYEWIYVGYALALFRLFSSSPVRERRTLFLVLATLAALTVAAAGFYQYEGYSLKISDSLFGSAYLLNAFTFFTWLAVPGLIALSAFWVKSAALSMVLVTTFSFGLGLASNQQFINFRGGQNTGDAAGLFANDFIGEGIEGEKILVVANSKFTAASAAFWIETESIDFLEVFRFTSVTQDVFDPGEYDWLLSVGEISLHNVPREVAVRGVGFELSKLGSSRQMYLSRISPNSPFSVDALEAPTAPWGIWLSDSEPIELFSNGVQQASELVIRYKLPEQSVGANLAVEVNGVPYEFEIPASPLSSSFRLDLGKNTQIDELVFRLSGNRERNGLASYFIPPDSLGLVSIELIG